MCPEFKRPLTEQEIPARARQSAPHLLLRTLITFPGLAASSELLKVDSVYLNSAQAENFEDEICTTLASES